MASDEKVYPISSAEEEQLINPPESAHVNTREVNPESQVPVPDGQAYTNPFINTSNTYDASAQYTNSESYPVNNNAPENIEQGEREGDKGVASNLSLCCGLTLW